MACSTDNGAGSTGSSSTTLTLGDGSILQPGSGDRPGDLYLASVPDQGLWGYVPNVHSTPVIRMRSGQTITIDAVSHEGILEDQGRDPNTWFGSHGVASDKILDDVKAVAAEYNRTPRNFAKDGPRVVTGPVFVEGAEPGDVIKIETLAAVPRVPYGVVSSRHGKGALARTADGPPAGITAAEIMPPAATDNKNAASPTELGNVSVFTPIEDGKG